MKFKTFRAVFAFGPCVLGGGLFLGIRVCDLGDPTGDGTYLGLFGVEDGLKLLLSFGTDGGSTLVFSINITSVRKKYHITK